MTDTNSGRKDAKGRTIWIGQRKGEYVIGPSGKKTKPAMGRTPSRAASRERTAAPRRTPSRAASRERAPTRLCAKVTKLKQMLPQWSTKLKAIVKLVDELARQDISSREDDLEVQSLFFQVDEVWDRVMAAGFTWAAYGRKAPREQAVAQDFAGLAKDAVFEAEHYCM